MSDSDKIRIYRTSKENQILENRVNDEFFAVEWSSVSVYSEKDKVMRNGNMYVSLSDDNQGNDPADETSAYWKNIAIFSFDNESLVSGFDKILEYTDDDIVGEFSGRFTYYSTNNAMMPIISGGKFGGLRLYSSITDVSQITLPISSFCYFSSSVFPTYGGTLNGLVRFDGGCKIDHELDGGYVGVYLRNNNASDGTAICIGNDDVVVFANDGVSSNLQCNNSDVATVKSAMPNVTSEFVQQAYAVGDFAWYDGDGATNGLYVAKTSIPESETFDSSHWTLINSLSSMFSSGNVALIRDDRAHSSGDVLIATIGGVDIYAPSNG